jgi:hypothetical protein
MRAHLLPLFWLTLSVPALAWDVRTDSEGDLVKWNKPVKLVLDSNASALLEERRAEDAIAAAVKNFDDATPYLDVSVTIGPAKSLGYVAGVENQNSILVLEDWPYSESALAVTLVTLNARTNEVLDADIAFNISTHEFRVLHDASRDERAYDDVQNTVTHELGHVLGLMHSGMSDDLVMYPSAPPGEILKRTLKSDDRDGLLSLYGTAPEPEPEAPALVGCSATSTSPSWLLLPLLALGLLQRHKRLVLLALVPAAAIAAEPVPAEVSRAAEVALVQVSARQSGRHPQHPGLIITALTLAPVECLKGTCAELTRVLVPGGRLGDLEQLAVHEPVPLEGQRILVTRTGSAVRVVRVEADVQAQIVKTLRSTTTQGAPMPPSPTLQTPAIRP